MWRTDGNVALPTRRVSRFFESHYIDGEKKMARNGEIFEDGRAIRSKTTSTTVMEKLNGSYRMESTWEGQTYITIEGQYTDGEKSGRWIQHNHKKKIPKPVHGMEKRGLN